MTMKLSKIYLVNQRPLVEGTLNRQRGKVKISEEMRKLLSVLSLDQLEVRIPAHLGRCVGRGLNLRPTPALLRVPCSLFPVPR